MNKLSKITSHRFNVYLMGLGFLLIFYLVYNSSKLFSPSTFEHGNIIILFSEESESKFQPPYCDIAILNQDGFQKLTDDENYDNSISYVRNNRKIFFESKKKNSVLGLSEESELYEIRLNGYEIKATDIPKLGNINAPVVSCSNGIIIAYNQQTTDSVYLKIYDKSERREIYNMSFRSKSTIDYYLADPYIVIYNYDVPPTDISKIQVVNFRSKNQLFTNNLKNKSIINVSCDGVIYFYENIDGNDNIYQYDPFKNNLTKINMLKIDKYDDYEIRWIINDREFLGINYEMDSNTLFHYKNGDIQEVFNSKYIDQVFYVPPSGARM